MPRQIVILRPCSWSKPVNASDAHFPVTFSSVRGEVGESLQLLIFRCYEACDLGSNASNLRRVYHPAGMMTMRR